MCASQQAPQLQVEISLPEWIHEIADWQKSYTSDEEKMALAIKLADENVKRSTGGPFGSAIFDMDSGKLLGVGVNQVVAQNNSTLHGEVTAIMLSQKRIENFTLGAQGARRELFTSCEPCAMCMGATLWSGVKRLVCAATGEDARAIGFDEGPVFEQSYAYLQQAGLEVKRQVLRDQGKQVLQDYLQSGGEIYNG
ncbi:nucleoside deaminase [Lacimicrobium alkaliphilum]|uniref:tRNA-specific adenosine deaminase n=1 Tax=Lacimicrobium alkaliphilum TaxID=1526571 RepID=A0ABQ1R132_9ALTE|nr:nucleoside deaminase [Lacimicrobium alkaliphilum]GGD54292.1 tRNA-specific adenosine deaminase [Lacimicrobium alkaliphilum]